VTKNDGKYLIDGIPNGQYTLHTTHIFGGQSQQRVTITDQAQTVNLSLISNKVVLDLESHKNKHGQQYQSANDDNSISEDDYYDDF